MGNLALVEKLLRAFSETLPTERQLLQAAIEAGDLGVIARVAHKLKGTASNMCADSLSESAHQLEAAARAENVGLVTGSWHALNKQVDDLLGELSLQGSNPL